MKLHLPGLLPCPTGAARLVGMLAAFLVCLAAAQDTPAPVIPVDRAPATVERFYAVLLDTMRDAKRLGVEGRYRKLEPAVRAAFDLPAMARISVGPTWTTLPPAIQTALVEAFARMSIATYASRFDAFSGERFVVEPGVERRGKDALVHTKLIATDRGPIALNYLLHATPEWKIVDVYLNGSISELASRRTEFTAVLKRAGPDALVSDLRTRTERMLSGPQ
jgi:phospholipid transport system substrate-binding protein